MSDAPERSVWRDPALQRFLLLVRRRWRLVLASGFAAAVLTAGIVLLIPRTWTAGAAFQAEAVQSTPLTGALAGLAQQFGNLPIFQQANPQFYADLLTSGTVLGEVASHRYPWGDSLVPLARIYGYEDQRDGLREFRTVMRLARSIHTSVNLRTNVITFSVDARSAELARALADSLIAALNSANIALRQSRATAEQEFSAQRAEETRRQLAQAEDALTRFYERNREIRQSASLQTEESRLRRAVDVAQSVYTQMRLQEEQAAIQAVRNTPSISVIDPPQTPVRPSAPKRRVAVVIGLIAGMGLAMTWLLLRAFTAPAEAPMTSQPA